MCEHSECEHSECEHSECEHSECEHSECEHRKEGESKEGESEEREQREGAKRERERAKRGCTQRESARREWHRVAPNATAQHRTAPQLEHAGQPGGETRKPTLRLVRLSKPSECPGGKLAHRNSQAAQQASESLAHTQQTLVARVSLQPASKLRSAFATCRQARDWLRKHRTD
jgi:hypothetical protein